MVHIGNFDPSDHDPHKSFAPLPSGWYAAKLNAAELRRTRSGDGQYLWLEWELLEDYHPDHKGRRAWDRLNLWHENPQARDIAASLLSAICHAVGVGPIDDTDALVGKSLAIKLRVRPETEDYDASNEIQDYDSLSARFQLGAPVTRGTTVPQPTAVTPPPPPSGQPGQAAQPPWKRPNGGTSQ